MSVEGSVSGVGFWVLHTVIYIYTCTHMYIYVYVDIQIYVDVDVYRLLKRIEAGQAACL